MINIGEIVETGIWIDGTETVEQRKQFEEDVEEAIGYFCLQHGVVHGPVKWTEKHPEESDVPPVPDGIKGERVRLLWAQAVVESKRVMTSEGSFISDLDKKDLLLLRGITRRAFTKRFPGVTMYDKDIDAIIEELGPEAALAVVREHYKKSLH